ncbi:MAG: hypothetical protein BWY79_00982 [Actinobacteria bacterium ADurb.Bin444]|nr:MAG: hypothetical protein BWY79_00982 [Actinobacteria bacterium ADurb.Bin444]
MVRTGGPGGIAAGAATATSLPNIMATSLRLAKGAVASPTNLP